MTAFSLDMLAERVAERAKADPATSYTAKLAAKGLEYAAKKLGEESVETVIAALTQQDAALIGESADLLYHLLVVLHLRGVGVHSVLEELGRRTAQSGLAEKAARPHD